MYKLEYLPVALKDLHDITDYISDILKAPQAAMSLLDTLEKSMSRLQEFSYSCKLYKSEESLVTEYRLMFVDNYLVFYVVNDLTVEIHRIIYSRMDYKNLIES